MFNHVFYVRESISQSFNVWGVLLELYKDLFSCHATGNSMIMLSWTKWNDTHTSSYHRFLVWIIQTASDWFYRYLCICQHFDIKPLILVAVMASTRNHIATIYSMHVMTCIYMRSDQPTQRPSKNRELIVLLLLSSEDDKRKEKGKKKNNRMKMKQNEKLHKETDVKK